MPTSDTFHAALNSRRPTLAKNAINFSLPRHLNPRRDDSYALRNARLSAVRMSSLTHAQSGRCPPGWDPNSPLYPSISPNCTRLNPRAIRHSASSSHVQAPRPFRSRGPAARADLANLRLRLRWPKTCSLLDANRVSNDFGGLDRVFIYRTRLRSCAPEPKKRCLPLPDLCQP